MEAKLREHEYKLLAIIWDNEPMPSREVVRLAAEAFGWKPTTTYTVIKNLSTAGYIENIDSVVRSLVTREQVQKTDSAEIVEKRFGGSLPKFVATFISGKGMTKEEAEEIRSMLEDYISE